MNEKYQVVGADCIGKSDCAVRHMMMPPQLSSGMFRLKTKQNIKLLSITLNKFKVFIEN